MDLNKLRRDLDKTMTCAFKGNTAAFLGSLLCSLEFEWDRSIPTAATNGLKLWWNPDWYSSLQPAARETVLLHELWHVARLHMLRCGSRDPKIWNYACDIRINNDLEAEGRSFVGIENCWKDRSVDTNGLLAEEDIYNQLIKNAVPPPPTGSFGDAGGSGDMQPDPEGGHASDNALTQNQKNKIAANVVRAVQQAKLMKQAGDLPGDLEYMIKEFLDPVLPWEQLLLKFFTDMAEEDYSWKRPNRRYSDVYLPSIIEEEDLLEHLMFFFDVSCSVTDEQAKRFCGEVKYIQEVIRPKKLTLVQFDTKIQHEQEFELDELFEGINIHGRGGTSLVCVKRHIEEHQPTAAIIFSDLECEPMDTLEPLVPVVWVCIDNPDAEVHFGDLIHIKE